DLLQPLDAPPLAPEDRGRVLLAVAVEDEDRALVEPGAVVRARRVGEVVAHEDDRRDGAVLEPGVTQAEDDALRQRAGLEADEAAHAAENGRAEGGTTGGADVCPRPAAEDAVAHERAREEEREAPAVRRRVPAEGDEVDVLQAQPRLLEAEAQRVAGEVAEGLFHADEALLLREGDEAPVLQHTGRGMAPDVHRDEAEDVHETAPIAAASSPAVTKRAPAPFSRSAIASTASSIQGPSRRRKSRSRSEREMEGRGPSS